MMVWSKHQTPPWVTAFSWGCQAGIDFELWFTRNFKMTSEPVWLTAHHVSGDRESIWICTRISACLLTNWETWTSSLNGLSLRLLCKTQAITPIQSHFQHCTQHGSKLTAFTTTAVTFKKPCPFVTQLGHLLHFGVTRTRREYFVFVD